MKKLIRCGAAAVLLAASSAWPAWSSTASAGDLKMTASGGELKLTIGNGRATLIAQDVPLRQILTEWERVGRTTIVNGDKMTGPAVTVQLVDRPEREVLEVILRSASGYVVANRASEIPGASMFDRVMILATSRGPVGSPTAPPAPFNNRTNMPQPMPMPMPDDDEPVESLVMPPGMAPPPGFPGQPGQMPNSGVQTQPGQLTAPRPGMLPGPPAGQPNPYAPMPLPVVVRPPGRPGGGPGGSS